MTPTDPTRQAAEAEGPPVPAGVAHEDSFFNDLGGPDPQPPVPVEVQEPPAPAPPSHASAAPATRVEM
jgi:hypothetical protein